MTVKLDQCAPLLNKRVTKEDAQRLLKDVQGTIKKYGGNAEEARIEILRMSRDNANNLVSKANADLVSKVTMERNRVEFSIDPTTGKKWANPTAALNGMWNKLTGVNSVDTKIRTRKKRFQTHLSEAMNILKIGENKVVKNFDDIKPGSDLELEMLKAVDSLGKKFPKEARISTELFEKMIKEIGDTEVNRLAVAYFTNMNYRGSVKSGVGIRTNADIVGNIANRSINALAGTMEKAEWIRMVMEHTDTVKLYGTSDEALTMSLLSDNYDALKGQMDTKNIRRHVPKAVENTFSLLGKTNRGFVGDLVTSLRSDAISVEKTVLFGLDAEAGAKDLSALIDTIAGKEEGWRRWRVNEAMRVIATNDKPTRTGFTTFVSNARFMMAASKLHSALPLAAISDAIENSKRALYVNGDVFGGVLGYLQNLAKIAVTLSPEEKFELRRHLGLAQWFHVYNEMARTGDVFSDTAGKAQGWIERNGNKIMTMTTGLPAHTDASLLATAMNAATMFSDGMNRIRGGETGTRASRFFNDLLREYGIGSMEKEILLNHYRPAEISGVTMYSGTELAQQFLRSRDGIPNLAKKLGVSEEVAARRVANLAEALDRYMDDSVVRGTPQPELGARIMLGRTNKVAWQRDLVSLVTQFKDTPVAMVANTFELIDKVKRLEGGQNAFKILGANATMYTLTGVSGYMLMEGAYSTLIGQESKVEKYVKGDFSQRKEIMLDAVGRVSYVPFLQEAVLNNFSNSYFKTAPGAVFSAGPTFGAIDGMGRAVKSGNPEKVLREMGKMLPLKAAPLRGAANWAGISLPGVND